MILEKHFLRSSGEQMHSSSSPPHEPFRRNLKNMAPKLIAKIAMEITKIVIINVIIVIKITNYMMFNDINI